MREREDEGFKKTLFFTLIISIGIGIMWMLLLFVIPRIAAYAVTIGSALILLLLIGFTALSG